MTIRSTDANDRRYDTEALIIRRAARGAKLKARQVFKARDRHAATNEGAPRPDRQELHDAVRAVNAQSRADLKALHEATR